jgi:hypothetical protein
VVDLENQAERTLLSLSSVDVDEAAEACIAGGVGISWIGRETKTIIVSKRTNPA